MNRPPAVVVVGAGVLGCALAWTLAARRIVPGDRILVLDTNPVASQATGRAAALMSLARPPSKAHWIPLVQRTLDAFDALGEDGFPVPLRRCGALHLAAGEAYFPLLDGYEATARAAGVAVERVAPREFTRHVPWLALQHFGRALWYPDEGYSDGYLLACGYAGAARRLGVRFEQGEAVSLADHHGRVIVERAGRRLVPDAVCVAAGAWSDALLAAVGATAAQSPVRSQYWITDRTPFARATMPMVSAPDLRLYARPESGAILYGLRESGGVAVASRELPADLDALHFDAADSRGHRTLEALAEPLLRLAPGLACIGLRHYVAGPSCYTPDGEPLAGGFDTHPGLYLLAGCNGAGIALSAGLADVVADAIQGRGPPPRFRPGRFGAVDTEAASWVSACIAMRAGKTGG